MLAWLALTLRSSGACRCSAGQIVTTGSCTGMLFAPARRASGGPSWQGLGPGRDSKSEPMPCLASLLVRTHRQTGGGKCPALVHQSCIPPGTQFCCTRRVWPPPPKSAERIMEAVMARKLAPGARLGEQQLAMLFDCSRTIVREALTRLAARGIVTVSARRGWYVVEPSQDEAREAFEARRVIETGLIRSSGLAGQAGPQEAAWPPGPREGGHRRPDVGAAQLPAGRLPCVPGRVHGQQPAGRDAARLHRAHHADRSCATSPPTTPRSRAPSMCRSSRHWRPATWPGPSA
jgi:hypothetical protein